MPEQDGAVLFMGPKGKLRGLTLANFWVTDVTIGVLEEKGLALLTVSSLCVVFAVVTHTTTDSSSGLKDSSIKVTRVCMVVTVAL